MGVNSEMKKHIGVTVQEKKDEDCLRRSERNFSNLNDWAVKWNQAMSLSKKEINSNKFLGSERLQDYYCHSNPSFQFVLP